MIKSSKLKIKVAQKLKNEIDTKRYLTSIISSFHILVWTITIASNNMAAAVHTGGMDKYYSSKIGDLSSVRFLLQ